MAAHGLNYHVHALGTDFEGHIDEVLGAVKEIQQQLHLAGAPKVEMHLSMSSRSDRPVKSIDEREKAV